MITPATAMAGPTAAPGASETTGVARPCDAIAWAETRDTAGRAGLGGSRAGASGGVLRTAGRRLVALR